MTAGLTNMVETTGMIDTKLSILLTIIGTIILVVSLIALFIPVFRHCIKNKPLKVSEGVQTAYFIVICVFIMIGLGIFIVGGNMTKLPVTIRTYDVINQNEVKIGTITATYDRKTEKLIDIDANWLGGKENSNDVKEMKSFFENIQK